MTLVSPLIDTFGRHIDYLRISVTDRCNFQCVYCVPAEGWPLMSKEKLISFEEIARVAKLFLQLGGRKIRLTGGEPLLRKDVATLVSMLSSLPGLKELGLTTNGFHLKALAKDLKEAGLQTVNVSLDSLDPSRFAQLTGSTQFSRVWEGVEETLRLGFKTKMNAVVLKGITDQEILDYGRLVQNFPLEVRFIEFMPLCGSGWHPEWMHPIREVRQVLQKHFDLVELPRGSNVAQTFEIKNGRGKIGFIASMTESFCSDCSRLRLTSEGKLRSCLFSNEEIDLRPFFQEDKAERKIVEKIKEAVRKKPVGHNSYRELPQALELPRIRFVGG